MIALTDSDIGRAWLMIATRPIVPSTAVSPSSRGMPAATSAPKATRRMISVSGIEMRPAFRQIVHERGEERLAWCSHRRSNDEVRVCLLKLCDPVDNRIDLVARII